MSDKDLKILIGVPSGGSEKTLFSVLCMNLFLCIESVEGVKADIQKVIAPYICRNRNDLVELAQKVGADYLMFLDNDMLFPQDIAFKLLEHDKDVVTLNYVTKNVPARFMSQKNGQEVRTVKGVSGLEKVDKAPTGMMLIRMDVFDKIEKPYFLVPPREKDASSKFAEFLLKEYNWDVKGNTGGEDFWFCQMCNNAGIDIYIDHDLTKVVSHLGEYPYSPVDACRTDEYTQSRFAYASPNLEYKKNGE